MFSDTTMSRDQIYLWIPNIYMHSITHSGFNLSKTQQHRARTCGVRFLSTSQLLVLLELSVLQVVPSVTKMLNIMLSIKGKKKRKVVGLQSFYMIKCDCHYKQFLSHYTHVNSKRESVENVISCEIIFWFLSANVMLFQESALEVREFNFSNTPSTSYYLISHTWFLSTLLQALIPLRCASTSMCYVKTRLHVWCLNEASRQSR